MRRGATAILLMLLLLSCGGTRQENMFTIKGNTGTPQGEVCLFGTDGRCDTIYAARCDEDGDFSITVPSETALPFALITPGLDYIPVYSDPGITAELQRDTASSIGWRIKGGRTQALHDSISGVLDACTSSARLYETIDSFILKYPVSDVNIEIFRRYLTGNPGTGNDEIRARITDLGGILQDHGFFASLKAKTDGKNSNIKHRSFPSFTGTTADSTEITQATYKKKYTLVTFWATWDSTCHERLRMLSSIQDSISSKSFAILNISLDYDSAAWRSFIAKDSIAGDNIMESKMFASPLASQFNIKSLPFTMLVSPYQRILEYDVAMDSIAAHIDSLARNYDKNQEKIAKRLNKK